MNGIASYKKTCIHDADTGTGKTVVLLHGFLESRDIWKKFAKKLSTDFRVVIIDLPGHGQTKKYWRYSYHGYDGACCKPGTETSWHQAM